MKQLLITLILLCGYILSGAQTTSLTVDNQTPGWLSSKINYGDQKTIINLTVTGYINHTDLNFIGDLMSKYNLSGHLNLTDAEVVDTEFKDSPISFEGEFLSMFNLDQTVCIKRFSIPKSLSNVSPYLLARVKADTLDYGGEQCTTLTNFLITNRSFDTNHCPKVLVLRDGLTKIEVFGTDEGKEKELRTVIFPKTVDSIGKDAFAETSVYPDTLILPTALQVYYTTSFPKKENQVIIIPECVSVIDNTYSLYNNTYNQWSDYDFIESNDHNYWIMGNKIPPIVNYKNSSFLKGSTVYIPYGSKSLYSSKVQVNETPNPFASARIIEIIKPVSGISLNYSDLELIEGETIQLEAIVTPSDASNKTVNWTTSDISVAMVSSDGTVYAAKPGQATIMATTEDGGFVALCKVTVKAKTVMATGIHLKTESATIAIGDTLQLRAILTPENVSNMVINWSSTNPTIATVDSHGLVKAQSEGKTQIIATTTDGSNLSAICVITIEKQFVYISQIQIEPSKVSLPIGESVTLTASIAPENASSKSISWSSTNPSVAVITQDGVVQGISEGEAIIIASTKDGSNLSATCQISVSNDIVLISEITLNPQLIEGEEDDSVIIDVSILPENATNKQLKWYSSNEDVAVVTEGVVKLKKKGTAIITAESLDNSNVKSHCTVVVSENNGIESIKNDMNTHVMIFNLAGTLIYEGPYSEAKITSGFYIIMHDGKIIKTILNN